jgi:hypothetical protein
MANYETLKRAFDGMDDATAATTFQFHLEEAVNHRDHGIAAMIARAYEAHRSGRLMNPTTRYDSPRDNLVPSEDLNYPLEDAPHTGQTTSPQPQGYTRGDDSMTASGSRQTETTLPGGTRLPFRGIPDHLRTPGPGSLETRLPFHTERYPLPRRESIRVAIQAPPFQRLIVSGRDRHLLIGTPTDRHPLPAQRLEDARKCSSCFESTDIAEITPSWTCEHKFCGECAIKLFSTSLGDTTRFPATCCGIELSLDNYMFFLPPGLVKRYGEKKAETEAKGFCSNPRCSASFKEEEVVGDIGTISACQTITCIA